MPNFPSFPVIQGARFRFGPVAIGSSLDAKPAVLTARFGGRYSQRTGNGINALPKDFNYRSGPLLPEQYRVLEDFLSERRGVYPFTFLVPHELTPRQFTCATWQTLYPSGVHQALVAVFEENFDP